MPHTTKKNYKSKPGHKKPKAGGMMMNKSQMADMKKRMKKEKM